MSRGGLKRAAVGGKYFFEYEVGMWAFGSIQVFKDQEAGVLRVCKSVEKRNLTRTSPGDVVRRLEQLQSLQSPHVARIVDVLEEPNAILIFSEFSAGGDVDDFVQRLDSEGCWIDESIATSYIRQVLMALVHCEQKGIYHGDLRPSSLLLTSRNFDAAVKVSDVGLFAILDPDFAMARRHGGSYTAPEVINGSGRILRGAADMWSVGAIAHTLLTGHPPSGNETSWGGMSRLLSGRGDEWENCTPLSRDFVMQLLGPASERPTAARALQHAWFKGVAGAAGAPKEDLAADDSQQFLCYMIAVLLVPPLVPLVDFESLWSGFNQSDTDLDGLINHQGAQRLLQNRGVSREVAQSSLRIADVGATGVIDVCAMAIADLIAREFTEGGQLRASSLAPRMMKRFFEVFSAQRQPTVTAEEVQARLRTATWREMELRAGVSYDEVLSVFPVGVPFDAKVLTSVLLSGFGAGTPLDGAHGPRSLGEGETIFGLDGIDVAITDIFKACGLGNAGGRRSKGACI